ncbi:MAG: hypothetical protein L6R19_09315 [Alphaproteobacteria bacterium]|nr:hypothetical protein [Alphaproteobacteria bacterium]
MGKPGRRFVLAAALAGVVTVGGESADAAAPDDLVRARLVAEDTALRPGTTAWVAVELAMKPGWHTYWRNPGDAGQATEIAWTLPPGFAAGAIHWPLPETFAVDIITSYGYADRVALLVPVGVPADAAPGSRAELAATVAWLACEKICIPGEAKLALGLPVAAAGARDAAAAALFGWTRDRLPREVAAPVPARYDAETIALDLPPALLDGASPANVAFLPFDDALIEHGAPQRLERGTLTLRRGPRQGDLPATTDGLLLVTGATGAKRGFNVTLSLNR